MMGPRAVLRRALFIVGLALLTASLVSGQTSAESVCRMSSRESQCPGPKACDGWEMSAQQRGQIACQRCHGGNPTASAVFPAHLGISGADMPRTG